jgi:hypothetical protein
LAFTFRDEYSPLSNLRLTWLYGDPPVVRLTRRRTRRVAALTFRDGERINTGELPKRAVLFSPFGSTGT